MTPKLLLSATLLLLGTAAVLLAGGCAVSLPFRGPGYDEESGRLTAGEDTTVVLALTRGRVARGAGRAFRSELGNVREGMAGWDGLLVFSMRMELVGDRVWTLSAWEDEASLQRFLDSTLHRRAASEGGISPADVSARIVELPASRVPLDWNGALALLAEEGAE